MASQQAAIDSLQATVNSQQAEIACLSIPTVLVYVPLLDRDSYQVSGSKSSGDTYVAGQLLFQNTLFGPYRNYFVFDLGAAGALGDFDLVVGAELITVNPPNGFSSDFSDTLTYVLNRVSTSARELMNGIAGTTGYRDLADGLVYGTYVASAAINNSQITIALSDKAVRDINRSRHVGFGGVFEPYLFAIGGSIDNLNAGSEAFLFGSNAYPSTNTALALNVRHYTPPACPMPADTQYQ